MLAVVVDVEECCTLEEWGSQEKNIAELGTRLASSPGLLNTFVLVALLHDSTIQTYSFQTAMASVRYSVTTRGMV